MYFQLIIFLLIILPEIGNNIVAQPMYFSLQTDHYKDLDTSQAMLLNDPSTSWITNNWYLPIGFDFPLDSVIHDSIYISTDGELYFFKKCNSIPNAGNIFLAPFFVAIDRAFPNNPSQSFVYYDIDSSGPFKILKLEFNNIGINGGEYEDFVNYQIWLHETGTVEYRFGPSHVTYPNDNIWGAGNDGPIIAINYWVNCSSLFTHSIVLTGNQNNPKDTIVNGSILVLPDYTIDNIPDSGIVYRFSYNPTGMEKKSDIKVDIYPNPNNGQFTISEVNELLTFTLTSIEGKEIFRKSVLPKKTLYITIPEISAGIYIAIFSNKHGSIKSLRLIID